MPITGTTLILDVDAMTQEPEKNEDAKEFALLLDLCQRTVRGQTADGDFSRLDEIVYKRLLSTYPGSDQRAAA